MVCSPQKVFRYTLTAAGRGIGIMSRRVAPEGYVDLDHDDYHDPDPFKEWQQIVLDTAHRIVVRV